MAIETAVDPPPAAFSQLIHVAPMADEYFATYAGRVANVHGTSSIGDLSSYLNGGSALRSWLKYLPLLAHTASLDLESFVELHTSYALNTLFVLDVPHFARPFSHWTALNIRNLTAPVPWLKSCPDCVAEDFDYWKFSYWRRSHQIPGVEWCPKHKKLLIASNLRPHVGNCASPSDHIYDSLSPQIDLPKSPRKIASRYTEIIFGLLEARGKFTHSQLVDLLNARAEKRGGLYASSKKGRTLSAVIKYSSPGEFTWAQELLRRPGSSCTFDLEVQLRKLFLRGGRMQTEAYALAMAVLFLSADEALRGLLEIQGR